MTRVAHLRVGRRSVSRDCIGFECSMRLYLYVDVIRHIENWRTWVDSGTRLVVDSAKGATWRAGLVDGGWWLGLTRDTCAARSVLLSLC